MFQTKSIINNFNYYILENIFYNVTKQTFKIYTTRHLQTHIDFFKKIVNKIKIKV